MKRHLTWLLVAINAITVAVRFSGGVTGAIPGAPPVSETAGIVLVTIVLSVLGAFIVLRADGNRVGWLMLLLAFVLSDPFRTYIEFNRAGLSGEVSPGLYFAIWTQGWLYFVILYAVFLILLNFPSGSPPSQRLQWVSTVSVAALAQFVLVYTFQPKLGDSGDASLLLDNPLARLDVPADQTFSGLVFGLGMIALAVISLFSIFLRFRKAGTQERAQIKWLLYSGVVSFTGIGFRLASYEPGVEDWTGYLLPASLLVLTLTIAIAILRYRLYDIDIIIRRTVQYALLTGILAILFFGSVVVLQGIFQGMSGSEESPLVTVISTLAIAALFTPLRNRIQDFIDRRFYRAKYNAENALAEFSRSTRDEVDVNALSQRLLSVVAETIRPEHIQLHLKPPQHRK